MKRITEPELMNDPVQARAYADADFSESDGHFITRINNLFSFDSITEIADLGCGPGNITFRLIEACGRCRVTGIDGSRAMLDIAQRKLATSSVQEANRVQFIESLLPDHSLPVLHFEAVVSNSLLHHLHDPACLWSTLIQIAKPGAAVLVVDLRRPESQRDAQRLVDTYAVDAPEVLRHDFYCSLLAAFEPVEVQEQLEKAGLIALNVRSVGDRYLEVWGHL